MYYIQNYNVLYNNAVRPVICEVYSHVESNCMTASLH